MTSNIRLEHYLDSRLEQAVIDRELKSILFAFARAGAQMARSISCRGLTKIEDLDEKPLVGYSQQLFIDAIGEQSVSFIASKETDEIIEVDSANRLGVAIDPLDGLSNIETNAAIGTVISILECNSVELFEKNLGDVQQASAFLFYGPQTRLIVTCGDGTYRFILDPDESRFYQAGDAMTVPTGQHEFAINTSNYRFWDDNLRYFIDDSVAGENGPLGEDFNMRWYGSLVAEAYRILIRGGVFLYPGDARPGYASGRLRLLYEALPLAFIVEQAGGLASDGRERILEMKLLSLQKRVPLIFGSADRVREVIDYLSGDAVENTRFPLFENRSLFRS